MIETSSVAAPNIYEHGECECNGQYAYAKYNEVRRSEQCSGGGSVAI